jgi:hypothetical protein
VADKGGKVKAPAKTTASVRLTPKTVRLRVAIEEVNDDGNSVFGHDIMIEGRIDTGWGDHRWSQLVAEAPMLNPHEIISTAVDAMEGCVTRVTRGTPTD